MTKKGLTYVEVMVGVAVFMLMAVFIIRMAIVAQNNTEKNNEILKMAYIAQSQIERYKTNPVEFENKDVEGFYVTITSEPFGDSDVVEQVTVTVRKTFAMPSDEDVIVQCHVLKK